MESLRGPPRPKGDGGAEGGGAAETAPSDDGTQAILLANCFAQSALLMRGVSAAETEQALLAGGGRSDPVTATGRMDLARHAL